MILMNAYFLAFECLSTDATTPEPENRELIASKHSLAASSFCDRVIVVPKLLISYNQRLLALSVGTWSATNPDNLLT